MVHRLFGSPDIHRPEVRSNPFLEAVLPLEYYFWQTETIGWTGVRCLYGIRSPVTDGSTEGK